MTALLHRAKGQRLNEYDFEDVSHLVSRRVVEDCLDIVCHNTNVLQFNNILLHWPDRFASLFKKHGLSPFAYYVEWQNKTIETYQCYLPLYKKWAAYAKGNNTFGEPYVCDSDNGPEQLIKVLNSVEYAADTIDLVVALNRALDVVHSRSDLALAFIEGGAKTCNLVSNLPDKFVI